MAMGIKKDYEKLQYTEQKETNLVLWINTVATIITGMAAIVLSIVALIK